MGFKSSHYAEETPFMFFIERFEGFYYRIYKIRRTNKGCSAQHRTFSCSFHDESMVLKIQNCKIDSIILELIALDDGVSMLLGSYATSHDLVQFEKKGLLTTANV
jgi:hypothetical protein